MHNMLLISCEDKVDVLTNTIYEKYIEINVCAGSYFVLKIPKKKHFFGILTQNFIKTRCDGEKPIADSDSVKKCLS